MPQRSPPPGRASGSPTYRVASPGAFVDPSRALCELLVHIHILKNIHICIDTRLRCFVDPSCPHAVTPAYLPGVALSYDACSDNPAVLDACPFRDQSKKRLVNTFVRDHTIRCAPCGLRMKMRHLCHRANTFVRDHTISDATSPTASGSFVELDPAMPLGTIHSHTCSTPTPPCLHLCVCLCVSVCVVVC